MNGPGSTNTLIVAVVVFLVVSLGAAVFFWWRSMYGVWSLKRRPQGPGSPHTTADGSPIIIIPATLDTFTADPSPHPSPGHAHPPPAAPTHTTHHHHTATGDQTPWSAPDSTGHHAGGFDDASGESGGSDSGADGGGGDGGGDDGGDST